jgi:hypothetical protein
MLNGDSYNQYFATPGAKAALITETNKRNPGKRIDYRTPTGERELRKTALDLVNDNRIAGTDVRYSNIEDLGALQRGYGGGGTVSKEEKKEQTALSKAKESPIWAVMEYMKGKRTEGDSEPGGFVRISGRLPGAKLMSVRKEAQGGGSSPQAYEGVYLKDGNMYVKENENSAPVLIKPNKRYNWLSKIAEANGVHKAELDKMYKEMFPGSSPESEGEASKIAYDDAVTDFEAKGGLGEIKKYMGDYFDFNKTRVQLTRIDRRGDSYEITYVTPDGKEVKKGGLDKKAMASLLKLRYD